METSDVERLKKELEKKTQNQEDVHKQPGQRDTQRLIHKAGPTRQKATEQIVQERKDNREQGLQDCIASTQSVLLPIEQR